MAESDLYDGASAADLATRLRLPLVMVRATTGSTLDEAHRAAAEGAPAGTLVIADEQTMGRGRSGHRWDSVAGQGIWLTMVERPPESPAISVLSLRLGLGMAESLDVFAPQQVRVKWPNDLMLDRRKLGGILVEARWRDDRLEWMAIGVGVNVAEPELPMTAGLRSGTNRLLVLSRLVPAIRDAAAAWGTLTESELKRYRQRDAAVGRRCSAPARGIVAGITSDGALLVDHDGVTTAHRGGSLIFEEAA